MNGNPGEPNPWLNNGHPPVSPQASWVEYLRWMRFFSDNGTVASGTILQLFKQFEVGDISQRLNQLSDRTKELADFWFEANCPGRIRVGGTKGPEQMLLPAFDALGMPYIPSSTLKGVARAIATEQVQTEQVQTSEIDHIFGNIDPDSSCMGQVIFLDAYPVGENDKLGGLQLDMANQIWKWNGTQPPQYHTNPNIFTSLEKPKFIIGLRKSTNCSDETFERVIHWLKAGLAEGVGAQVNTGYGALVSDVKPNPERRIFRIRFQLEGQLIHGHQTFNGWERNQHSTNWKPPGTAVAELRPTAFRSMLRYWFRALGLGVLSSEQVRDLELELFGGIEPKPSTGMFRVEVQGQIERQLSRQSSGLATGILTFRYCPHANRQGSDRVLKPLLQHLTWLMFHLGGVGQGARRPCYSRNSNPYWRGTQLICTEEHEFWHRPANIAEFKLLFVKRMRRFYQLLGELSNSNIDTNNPNRVFDDEPTATQWAEAIDRHCEIVCVSGRNINHKPFALAELHQLAHNGERNYNSALCGNSNEMPSPIWITKIETYQVVTVFGAQEENRSKYIEILDQKAEAFETLWPLPRIKKPGGTK